jgi:hypothetical protein
MPILKWSDVPGLTEALKRENDIRDASFLDLNANLCGVEIRQMTPQDLLILDGIGNPLMAGGLPSPAELADFLWKLSPRFKLNAPIRRFLFGRSVRKKEYLSLVKACGKYISDTFQDSPGSSGPSSTPYAGWCAYLVNNIAMNYHWSEDKILRTPLKRLFQYLKCIRRYHNPDAPMHNPSDKMKGDYIRLENARNSLLKTLRSRFKN